MDDGGSPLPGLVVFLLLVILSVILHLYRAALLETIESNIEKEAENGNQKYQYILRLIENPFLLDGTIQIITICTGLTAGLFLIKKCSAFLQELFESLASKDMIIIISWVIIIVLMLIFSISISYLAPKKIGTYHGEKIVLRLTGVVKVIILVLMPINSFMNAIANMIVRFAGVDPHDYEDDVTEDEIIDLVDEAHEQGVILESEAEMIQNIMEFGDKCARDIMTHRKNVNAIESSTSLKDAVEFMLENTNTRYPVYTESIDNIIGIIHLKDAAELLLENTQLHKPVSEIEHLIRYVGFIPETRNIDSIFKAMKIKKVHMAVVIDEYGQTSGIVTMEDILEEIVGNILDEYDDSDDFIQPQYDDSVLMDGLTPLERVGEVLDLDFTDQEFETLNGYLTSLLGHIPTEDDREIKAKGYCFFILKVENNIIQTLKVTKLQEEEEREICQDIQNLPT